MTGSLCAICKAALVLIIIGAINWGLVGLGGFMSRDLNVVHLLLGNWPVVEWIVYILVGLAGVFKIFDYKCPCHNKNMA